MTARTERPETAGRVEVRDFVDDVVLRLVAIPMGSGMCLTLHAGNGNGEEKGGIAAVGYAAPRPGADGKLCDSAFIDAADLALEKSIAAAVAELVAMETDGGVSMCCQTLPADLAEEAKAEIADASLAMARNLVSKIRMRQA